MFRFLTKLQPTLNRETIAGLFLKKGEGIEIGPLQSPLKVPAKAKVTYVDRLTVAELREHYPELGTAHLVEPGIIDDSEKLTKIGDESQDFVIANHFIEHCADPIGAIKNILRVLKDGCVAYLAIPDKRFTFDKERDTTTIEHLLRDYREGPEWSRHGHFEEWVRIVNKVDDGEWAANRIAHYMEIDYSIHYHVWTQTKMLELFATLKNELGFSFDVDLFVKLERGMHFHSEERRPHSRAH